MKNKKKGLNLIAKFMLMSLAPLIVTFIVAQFAISLVATQVAENLVGNMLASNVHLINNAMGLQVQVSSMPSFVISLNFVLAFFHCFQ